jgi:hypothetical protein
VLNNKKKKKIDGGTLFKNTINLLLYFAPNLFKYKEVCTPEQIRFTGLDGSAV